MAKRRRKARSPALAGCFGWSLLLLLMAAVAIFLTSTGKRWLSFFIAQPVSEKGGFWQVYFTSETDPEMALSDLIKQADSTVWMAFYELNNPSVVLALLDVKDKVDVRIVVESDNADSWGIQRLKEANIPIKGDGRKPLMHNKFAVIDGSVVWTGSYNLTPGGSHENYDNALVIYSRALAQNYQKEFLEMWHGQFGGSSPRNTQCCFLVDSTRIENYFAPEDGVASHLLSELSKARKQIVFMAYSFTDKKIAGIITQKHNAGLDVQGIFNWRQKNDKYSVWPQLSQAGIPVYFSPTERTLHHKVMVIDSQTVITGSFNFTKSANKRNDENLLIISSRALALAYLREFARIKSRSHAAITTVQLLP